MVNLTRVGFDPEDALGNFTSAAMVLDQDRVDSHKGKVVAVVFYSPGGNIIYKHDPDYLDLEILAAGEKYVGELLAAARYKVFNVATTSPRKYPVVCLCGSTRFQAATLGLAETLTLAGHIVLMVNCWSRKDALHDPQTPEDQAVKERLDDIHKEKIRLADKVLVVNISGYIGKSTRSEIDFATSIGKPVDYVEPLKL